MNQRLLTSPHYITKTMKTKNALCGLVMAVVLHLGVLAGSAQTYIYTYTGNNFTSASGPYTASDKVTGSITLSALLGDNYAGNPSATLLNFVFTDGVGPQNIVLGGGLVQDFTFATDSSGVIVFWNFQVLDFLPPFSAETKFIQTENDSGNVVDSGNLDEASGIVGGQCRPIQVSGWKQSCRSHHPVFYLSRSRRCFFGLRAVQATIKTILPS